MKIIQIFSKDYPNNKTSLFTYESDFYYDLKIQTISNRKGWKINIQKKRFQTTFKKNVEELIDNKGCEMIFGGSASSVAIAGGKAAKSRGKLYFLA